uniref:Uncharacterized protein n=1 Tax=Anguilla anguilla TaxID=7936 RepID=A0A0E9QVX4_ANGAN
MKCQGIISCSFLNREYARVQYYVCRRLI